MTASRENVQGRAPPSSKTPVDSELPQAPQPQSVATEMARPPALAFPVVCVGASAGGLEAFTQSVGALPTDTGMAFVFVSHLAPSHPSHLAEILSRATRMPVTEVRDEPTVEANSVYVIPPDNSMIIEQGSLKLLPRQKVDGLHHPSDVFLESLALDQRHKSIAIILSGTGSDGTLGMDEIKAAGGITFAQDESATYEGMPRSAALAGTVDFRLPPAEIARELGRIARHAYIGAVDAPERIIAAGQTSKILQQLQSTTGVDFSNYKAATLKRRIVRRMALHKLESLPEYTDFLRSRPAEVEALFQDILINVTSFFRDPETFELLKTRVFPRMAWISCRNMRIYREPVLQQHLLPTLHYWLKGSGLLVLGGSESTGHFSELFEPLDAKHRVYSKKANVVRVPPPLMVRSFADRRAHPPAVQVDPRSGETVQREAERILLA